jgi:hypothetical protein
MASRELDDAVRRIVELMLANEWEAGPSHLDFAEHYGVGVSTVRAWAADASRFIRICVGDEQDIRDECLRNVRRIGSKAEEAGDYRSALGAQELRLKVHGALERKQREDDVTDEVPVEQLAAALRAMGHEVKLNGRPIAASPGPTGRADEGDTERPQRVEGFLESDDEDGDDE